MRILIRTSKWAIWARRLGGFALPIAVIPVFMHRAQSMTTETFHLLEASAATIAGLALFIGIGACVRLWFTGDRGWGRAIGGILLALICLAPFGFVGFQMLRYPQVTDVSTDPLDRPELISPVPAKDIDAATQAKVEAAFPNARSRRYQVDAITLFGLVAGLVKDRGWQVLDTNEPEAALGQGQINAVVTTLVGWRSEVAIRVTGDAEGTSVAMRSASLTGLDHDLGANGQRIEDFLVGLDTEVTLWMRDLPPPATGDEAEPDAEPAAPAN